MIDIIIPFILSEVVLLCFIPTAIVARTPPINPPIIDFPLNIKYWRLYQLKKHRKRTYDTMWIQWIDYYLF